MNILIINAFGSSQKSKNRFEIFFNLIKSLFKKVSKGSGIEFIYICRSPNNIEEFLYKIDMISGDINQNKKYKKNFDKLDIVIIDGYEKYAPWGNKSSLLCEFIKLCKITKKILYAGGVALEILIYYLSTGSLNEYNFVNSKGQIKSIEEMSIIPYKYMKELKNNDMFLDFVTGDIFEYKNNETWIPIKNIGLHKQKTAEKYINRGKFVLTSTFKGKDYIKNIEAYVTVCNEIKVQITRQYLHHFLVDNLPLEFIASTSLTCYPHFVNVNSQALQFKVICESERGPIVIEHENSIGVLFHPSEKYKESVTLLENFIRNKFNEVQNKLFKFKNVINNKMLVKPEKNDIPSIFKYFNSYEDRKKDKLKYNGDPISKHNRTNLEKVNNSRAFSRIKKVKTEAGHVGFGFNNRDMIFVENNYINQKPLFHMYTNSKTSTCDLLYNDRMKLNMNKLILKKNITELPEVENKKNDIIKKIKNFHIIIKSDNNAKKIKKRNYFISFDNKKNLNLKKITKNYYDNLYLPKTTKKSKSSNKNNILRMKSANLLNKNILNFNKRCQTQSNIYKDDFHNLLSIGSKDRNDENIENNEIQIDEIYEPCIPKYPRPANLEKEKDTIKSSDNNLNLLLSLINKDKVNNNYSLSNDRFRKSNFGMNYLNKNIDTLNSMKERNFININEISDKRRHKLNTIFY